VNEPSLIAALPCARVGQRMRVPGTARYSHTQQLHFMLRHTSSAYLSFCGISTRAQFHYLTGYNRIIQVRTCKETNCQRLCPFSRGFPPAPKEKRPSNLWPSFPWPYSPNFHLRFISLQYFRAGMSRIRELVCNRKVAACNRFFGTMTSKQ
jgi:hypothetical protein